MKGALLFFTLVAACAGVNAQRLAINSTIYYGGSGGERFERIIETSDGGFLGVGATSSNDGNIPTHPAHNIYDSYLITKHDTVGALQWAKVYGGSGIDRATCAAQMVNGDFVIAGYTNSDNFDIGGRIGNAPSSTSDVWVLGLSSSGNIKWQQTYGSSVGDDVSDILPTADGGFLLLMVTSGSDSDAVSHVGSQFYNDWILIKADSQGKRQWRKAIAGTGNESDYSRLFQAPSGGYYLVGNSGSHDGDLDEDNLWPGNVQPTNGPVFLKLTDSGQVQWCKRYGGTGGHILYNVKWDSRDSSLVATGYSDANSFYFTGNHLWPSGGNTTYDAYLMKVDRHGELIFSKLFGTISREEGRVIGLHPEGGYLIGGMSQALNPVAPPYIGGLDLWLVQVDPTGDSVASIFYGGTMNDYPTGTFWRGNTWKVFGYALNPPLVQSPTAPGSQLGGNLFVSKIEYWPLQIRSTIAKEVRRLHLVPNPAGEIVLCRFPFAAGDKVEVHAADGRLMYQAPTEYATELTIDVGKWPRGTYTVTVRHDGQPISSQLLLR